MLAAGILLLLSSRLFGSGRVKRVPGPQASITCPCSAHPKTCMIQLQCNAWGSSAFVSGVSWLQVGSSMG